MTIGNTFENELATLIFNASSIVNIAINATTAPLTTLAVSLHTGDPGEAGTMSTNETSYGAYTRVAVNRTAITHAAIGVSTTGAAKILFSGTVTPNISVSAGVTPRLTTASTIVLC
jgi:hypothetical protein